MRIGGARKLGTDRGARTHACSVHNRVNALRSSREIDARKTTVQNQRVTGVPERLRALQATMSAGKPPSIAPNSSILNHANHHTVLPHTQSLTQLAILTPPLGPEPRFSRCQTTPVPFPDTSPHLYGACSPRGRHLTGRLASPIRITPLRRSSGKLRKRIGALFLVR
jgi:hypothetical protein